MTWLKKDDRYPEHRKIRRLSDGAYRLHDTALCWAAKDETDGFISDDDLDEMQHGRKLRKYVPELVRACLWEPVAGGWTIHDFLHYNPSHQQLEAERAAARDRQARHRARKKGVNTDESPDSNAVTNAVTNGDVTRESHPPVPYRTEPYRTEPDNSAPRADVESVCSAMSEALTHNRVRHSITRAWRESARLMIDRDGRELGEIFDVIDFAATDGFWSQNIHGLPKLREQYDKLRLKMNQPAQLSRSGSFFQAELARIEQQEREQRRGNVIPLQLGAGA